MAITINGSGTISGISAGGLPDGSVTAADLASGAITSGALPAGSVVKVQNDSLSTAVAVANSGSGRVYADLLTISYTPVSASNKLVLIGTSGFTSFTSSSDKGAFGIVLQVDSTDYWGGDYPWYNGTRLYATYPPDTTISRTVAVPTGSTFDIKLRGFSYNESYGTMTPRFYNYALTVMEIAA